jgi:hypothetical protein
MMGIRIQIRAAAAGAATLAAIAAFGSIIALGNMYASNPSQAKSSPPLEVAGLPRITVTPSAEQLEQLRFERSTIVLHDSNAAGLAAARDRTRSAGTL